MLSADVDAGLDPIYASVSEKNNASYLGRGIGLNKYTGARGKSGASDANAEFVAEVRKIFEENDVRYQIAELGKVDIGGGGTIAYILANKGIDVIDCGVPVLSMHSPYEVTSKLDLYEAHRGYEAFWKMHRIKSSHFESFFEVYLLLWSFQALHCRFLPSQVVGKGQASV